MLKKLLKEKGLVGNSKFHYDKKEQYTLAEVRDIMEDYGRFHVNLYDDVVGDFFTEYEGTKKTELEKAAKIALENEAKVKEIQSTIGDVNKLKSQIAEYEGKVKSYEEELKPIRTEKRKTTATGLLKGLVASGAELDVYDKLNDALKEVEIKDGEDAKAIAKKLSPLLEPIFKERPYLKPIVATKPITDETFNKPKSANGDGVKEETATNYGEVTRVSKL